jgi:hypothetical protein
MKAVLTRRERMQTEGEEIANAVSHAEGTLCPVARWAVPALLAFVSISISVPGAAAPPPMTAEFAFRWDPADGGPKTPEEVLTALGEQTLSPDRYKVRYYDVQTPASAPEGAVTALRERTKSHGKTQFRLKYRFSQPLVGAWSCPAGEEFEPEEEVDVSIGVGGRVSRAYSYSCTVKSPTPPRSLKAVPKGCWAGMKRYTSGDFKVEDWSMPGGGRILEVSMPGVDTAGDLEKFRQVTEKLLGRGAKPSDRSKTELGSACP